MNASPPAWIWTGLKFAPAAGIPATDRGFRYGMSVFESFPVQNGVARFLDRHLEKLRAACAAVGFVIPKDALEQCAATLEGHGFGRIYVTAGDGPVTGPCDDCRLLMFVEPRQAPDAAAYHRGYDLAMHNGVHVPLFAGLKTGNYWANLAAFREGVDAQCNETLLFNRAGHLISACMANVFVVTRGQVLTPDTSTGARAGVMRDWVTERIEVTPRLLNRAEVEASDEIFLTSSWLGVMPAASIAGRALQDRTVAKPLLEAFRK